jgi:glutaredoxin-related protein
MDHTNLQLENGNLSSTVPSSTEEPTISKPSIQKPIVPETSTQVTAISERTTPEASTPELTISEPQLINPKNENIALDNSNLSRRVSEFAQQYEALANLNELDIDQIPVMERLGLSNEELALLELTLTLPFFEDNSAQVLANITLTTEAEIQGYINYVVQRKAFEQTKEELLQNQIAIRTLEEHYEPESHQKLFDLLVSQTALLAQLSNQKQNLLQVENQAQLEALMLDNYKPVITTSASLGLPDFEQANTNTSFSFQSQKTLSDLTPLPVGLPCPEGLVFRVQVGAFRKPVPAARFREFTPVDGQVLANGLTVYMAGYFQTSSEALQQQKFIRTLGYADAFVVAYQHCTRLNLAQGRALERQFATANTNAAAPGSLFAGPGKGLYYSVQVGVYNRPITSEAQLGLSELIEVRTAKGQYRYASGKFSSLKEAKSRQQQAVGKGITDAFIVAYFDGKRIDLAQAKLLSQSGIDFETFEKVEPPTTFTAQLQQQIQTLQLPEYKKVIPPDPICRYELRCSDCLNELSRFNRVGVFIYDDQKEMIISAVQKESQWNLVQQMYLKEMRKRDAALLKGSTQQVVLEESVTDGAFMDWLLRQNNGYELFKDEQGQLQLKFVQPLQE